MPSYASKAIPMPIDPNTYNPLAMNKYRDIGFSHKTTILSKNSQFPREMSPRGKLSSWELAWYFRNVLPKIGDGPYDVNHELCTS